MQREFLDPQGAIGAAGGDILPLAAVIPNVKRVVEAARGAGIAIAHTREGHAPDLADVPPAKRLQYLESGIEIGAEGPLGRFFVRGERGHDFVDELAPAPGEWVIDKPGFGAFYATDLEHRLRQRGIRDLILTGVTTQCCVHTTLREAVDRGFRCLTVADACATQSEVLQAATLAIIASEGHLFGWITDTDRLTAALA